MKDWASYLQSDRSGSLFQSFAKRQQVADRERTYYPASDQLNPSIRSARRRRSQQLILVSLGTSDL